MVIWALGTLRHVPSSCALLPSLVCTMPSALTHQSPLGLSNTLWGLSVLIGRRQGAAKSNYIERSSGAGRSRTSAPSPGATGWEGQRGGVGLGSEGGWVGTMDEGWGVVRASVPCSPHTNAKAHVRTGEDWRSREAGVGSGHDTGRQTSGGGEGVAAVSRGNEHGGALDCGGGDGGGGGGGGGEGRGEGVAAVTRGNEHGGALDCGGGGDGSGGGGGGEQRGAVSVPDGVSVGGVGRQGVWEEEEEEEEEERSGINGQEERIQEMWEEEEEERRGVNGQEERIQEVWGEEQGEEESDVGTGAGELGEMWMQLGLSDKDVGEGKSAILSPSAAHLQHQPLQTQQQQQQQQQPLQSQQQQQQQQRWFFTVGSDGRREEVDLRPVLVAAEVRGALEGLVRRVCC